MKRSRVGYVVLIVLIFLLIIGGWFFYRSLPSAESFVPSAPVLVDIVAPLNGVEVSVGDSVSIEVKAMGIQYPLASLELWIDGQLFGQEAASEETADVGWVWQPLSLGVHSLVARARDTQGFVGQSQVAIVNVIGGETFQTRAGDGQTLEDIGAMYGVPLDQMSGVNPGVSPSEPLQNGQPVQVPSGGDGAGQESGQGGTQPPAGPTQPPNVPPNPIILWISQKLLPIPTSVPAEPDLDIALVDCKIFLYIFPQSDNEDGYIVYRHTTSSPGFQKITVLGPGEMGYPIVFVDWITPTGFNSYEYYVSSFNLLGENPSPIVHLPQGYFDCKPDGSNFQLLRVKWKFQPVEAMDQYYCYQSNGDGLWNRIPSDPFTFFTGATSTYEQLGPFNGGLEPHIMMQCWGWAGGVLKYLGEGDKKVSLTQYTDEVAISAAGFSIIGIPDFMPDIDIKPEDMLGGGGLVTPPFALREPETPDECAQHYGNPLAKVVCSTLMNAKVKQYIVLEWEWEPKIDFWPTDGPSDWLNDISGYVIYEIDPFTQQQIWMKQIENPNQKATALPLPWGYHCYGVVAYLTDPIAGYRDSEMITYCPDQPPEPEKSVVNPSYWLTTDGLWVDIGCGDYGGAPAFKISGSEMYTGSLYIQEPLCFRQGDASAAVKFIMPELGNNAVIQKATLRFTRKATDYQISGVATNQKPLCMDRVGLASQDWDDLSLNNNHLINGTNSLVSGGYYSPYTSNITWNPGSNYSVDVTSAVVKWFKDQNSNHGFVLMPSASEVAFKYYCYSLLDNMQLEIMYFVPGN